MKLSASNDAGVQELLDREAIRDCLFRYCRGIDRCDPDVLRSAYWPGAIDDHGMWKGPIEDFIPFVIPVLLQRGQTSHRITNAIIRIDGATAVVESYFDAYERVLRKDGTANDITATGRYLDNFEKRDGEWRIGARKVILDAFRVWTDSADWERGLFGQQVDMGIHTKEDLSYGLLGDIT
ncbi:hypothetical protein BH09ACT10_BH09ACT10_10150 [soil metagenome]